MYKTISILLVFVSSAFLSRPILACDIPLGIYAAITESEFSLSLEIFKDNRYRFVHKNWLPGDLHHVGEEHIYKGIYDCEGSALTLNHTDIGKPIVGVYRNGSSTELHFPIDKESMVLDFTAASNSKSIVSGRLYWPPVFINELFK